MTKTILFSLLSLLVFLAPTVNAESMVMPKIGNPPLPAAGTLYFSPLPTSNNNLNLVKIQPVANYLSEVLKRPVKPKLYESYDDILQALANNDIQFAELGPLPYLTLKKKNPDITPLVSINKSANTSQYECVLAAPYDGIQSLKDLQNLAHPNVALTQPLSTCGWLVTNQLLQSHDFNLQENSYAYLGSHQKVALALIRKEFTVGGLARFIAERYQPLGLQILHTSEIMPPFVVVANTQTLTPETLKAATQALLNYTPAQYKDVNNLGFSLYDPKPFDAFSQHFSNTTIPTQNSQGMHP